MLLSFRHHFEEFFRKLSRFNLLFILLPYILLVTIASYFAYQRCVPTYIEDGVKYTRKSICGNIKSAEALPTPKNSNEKRVDAKVYTDSEASFWEIIDTGKSPHFPTGLKVYDKDSPSPIVRWNNFLIAFNQEHYIEKSSGSFLGSAASEHFTLQSQIRTVRAYNIDTGETFDISLEKPTWGEIWYTTSQIVDNTYYFGVGGAFGASLGYKLDLPPQRSSRITKLKSSIGGKITKYGNIYVSSFCYEGCTYSLFNSSSLTTTPLQRMTDANNGYIFNRKEEFLGIDSKGRMILNVRNIPQDSNNQQSFDTESIAAVPLADEKSTIILLKAADLPEKGHKYFMIDGMDKILMLGSSKAYVYNIASNKFNEIQIGPKHKDQLSSNNIFITKTDKSVCIADTESVKFAIDLTIETYLDTPPSDCKTVYSEKSEDNKFKELNLPDNFEFVYTPAVFKTYNVVKETLESELPKDSEIIE